MVKIKDIISSLRPHQWYKNLLIFIAIIFSRNFSFVRDWLLLIIGFIALCLISSANYLCNDVIDRKRDSLNKEKSRRPIASGKVSVILALIIAVLLLIAGVLMAYQLNHAFASIGAVLFFISLIYSLYIKNILFADIIAVSFNFVLRAISGAIILGVYISPWLVIGVFFFGLYVVTGKRYGEAYLLKEASGTHRPVLLKYSKDILMSLFSIFLAVLIVTFSLFSFLSENHNLLWTIPLFLYLLLRYYYLILSGSEIVRNPEKIIRDVPMVMGGLLFIILIIIIMLW